jgi:hypothetical protein
VAPAEFFDAVGIEFVIAPDLVVLVPDRSVGRSAVDQVYRVLLILIFLLQLADQASAQPCRWCFSSKCPNENKRDGGSDRNFQAMG